MAVNAYRSQVLLLMQKKKPDHMDRVFSLVAATRIELVTSGL